MAVIITQDKRSHADRTNEIGRMVQILAKHKDMRSLTFFQYVGSNYLLKKPITKIRLTKQRKGRTNSPTLLLTIGKPNFIERAYIDRFKAEYNCWPADTYQNFPKKRVA